MASRFACSAASLSKSASGDVYKRQVVSRRAVIESENSQEREQILENLAEGSEVKGIVKNLTDYGAFVDLGGVDGLLHITDMAWKRVKPVSYTHLHLTL